MGDHRTDFSAIAAQCFSRRPNPALSATSCFTRAPRNGVGALVLCGGWLPGGHDMLCGAASLWPKRHSCPTPTVHRSREPAVCPQAGPPHFQKYSRLRWAPPRRRSLANPAYRGRGFVRLARMHLLAALPLPAAPRSAGGSKSSSLERRRENTGAGHGGCEPNNTNAKSNPPHSRHRHSPGVHAPCTRQEHQPYRYKGEELRQQTRLTLAGQERQGR